MNGTVHHSKAASKKWLAPLYTMMQKMYDREVSMAIVVILIRNGTMRAESMNGTISWLLDIVSQPTLLLLLYSSAQNVQIYYRRGLICECE